MAGRARSRMWRSAAIGLAVTATVAGARAEEGLTLYGAGSLREAMTEITQAFARGRGVPVRAEFGASGRMRERIEAGDTVDVFTSADIGHARTLVRDGRATVMAMFAQNALCVLVPPRLGPVTSAGLVDALLRPDLKLGVSPARIDPLGDYTVALFQAVERLRPGSAASLAARSIVLDNPPGSPPTRSGDDVLDALATGRVDLAVVYCSGRSRYARLAADVAVVPLPDAIRVGSQYGLAVMRAARPEAAWLALAILSPEGQGILARHGFSPVGLPASP